MLQRFSIRFWLNVLGGGGLVAIGLLAALGYQVVGQLVRSLEMSTEVASALRNHLQADMMHDAIRGDVLLSLHEAARANRTGVEEARKDLKEHAADLVERLEANAGLDLPAAVKARIAAAKPALQAYVAEAETITGLVVRDRDQAESRFASFLAKFEALEHQMAEISDELKKFAGQIDSEGGRLAHSAQMMIAIVALAALLATMTIGGLAAHTINGWIARMVSAMGTLARGEALAEVPGAGRSDALGAMASAIQVFRDNAERIRALQAQREAEREAARKAQVEALRSLADTVERDIRAAVERLVEQSNEVIGNVDQMKNSAGNVSATAQSVSNAAGDALRSTEAVASAAEQMSASIRDIDTRLGEASGAIGSSVSSSDRAAETINRLASQVDRIGDVARLIADIAGQTNLLALNATIEAARAGDAGKGFAVVAGEVKNLASQTGRSTEDIARLTGEIRALTAEAVRDVGAITGDIKRVNEMTSAVAAAVQEQSAVTVEIARSVGRAADSVRGVSGRIETVSGEATASGARAQAVEAAVAKSGDTIGELRSLVVRALRSSDEAFDRRAYERFAVDWQGEIVGPGGAHRVGLRDVSGGGAFVKAAPALDAITDGTLRVDGYGAAMRFRTVSREGGLHVQFAMEEQERARWLEWLQKRMGRAAAA